MVQIDAVLGDRCVPTLEDIQALDYTRLCLMEGLRLYPEPPVLIRRALDNRNRRALPIRMIRLRCSTHIV